MGKEKKVWTKDVPVRALTRREIKELRKAGFHPQYVENPGKILDDFTDWVLDNVYPEFDFDDIPQPDCIEFAGRTLRITYGANDEVKNS